MSLRDHDAVPTTTLDLTAPEVVADPYPFLAEERARIGALGFGVAWHEPTGRYLAFDHATVSAIQRDRRFGRIWKDREPAGYLEPFNLLHRNQMMENEPPEHTRLRRPVAASFNRGHIERLRPRVREIAAALLAEVAGSSSFDVIGQYAEPLPVLVIAELLGVPASYAPSLRQWSQAIVRMYEPSPTPDVVDAAVTAATEFAALVRELVSARRAHPEDDLITDLAAGTTTAGDLSDDEVVAAVVLLLNAGHEASVNVFGNGLVAMLRQGITLGSLVEPSAQLVEPSAQLVEPSAQLVEPSAQLVEPSRDLALTVEEMLRYDSALQLFERTATEPVEVGPPGARVTVRAGEKIAVLLGSANRDPAVFDAPEEFRVDRSPNDHVAFGVGVHFCLGAPLARMELFESLTVLASTYPALALAGEPESRGTFVLRGYHRVPVTT
jgi:unspecific monooxygenase